MGGRERLTVLVVFFLGAILVAFLAAHVSELVAAISGVILILATLIYFGIRMRQGGKKGVTAGEVHLLDTTIRESAHFQGRRDIWT